MRYIRGQEEHNTLIEISSNQTMNINNTTMPIIVYIYINVYSFIENFLMYSNWYVKDDSYKKRNKFDSWHINALKTVEKFCSSTSQEWIDFKGIKKIRNVLCHCDLEKISIITNAGIIKSKEREYNLDKYFPIIIKLYNDIMKNLFNNLSDISVIKKPFTRFSQSHLNKELCRIENHSELHLLLRKYHLEFLKESNKIIRTFKIYE